MRSLFRAGVMALLLVGAAGGALAQSPVDVGPSADVDITARTEWWIDPTGTLDAAQVAAQAATLPWQPSRATQSHALGTGALWQRFTLGPLPPGSRWYLQVSFHGIDTASLYHQGPDGPWTGLHAGDHRPVAQWPIRDRIPVFEVATPDGARAYLLRMTNQPIPVGAQLRLMREDTLGHWRNTSLLLLGAYFGLAVLVIYLGALSARQYADRAFALYCLYAASMMMIQLCFMGVGGLFVWPQSPWWNNAAPYVFAMLSCATGTLLVREVCGTRRLSAPLDHFVLAWAAFGVVWAVAYTAWPAPWSFAVLTLYQVATLVLVLAVCVWSHRHGERWALWMAVGFLPVIATAPFPTLRNWGVLSASFLTQYSLAIGAALEIPLQLWVLGRRARELSESRVRARAMDTRDPLTGLPVPEVLTFRLRDALRRARRTRLGCAVLAVDLSNHADILAAHGREAADRALVLAAARLMGVARDVDTVARTGASQFVMLLEGPVKPAEMVALATQALAGGLRPSPRLPPGVTLRFHIATVLAPDPKLPESHDADACLSWLADTLAALPPDARKTIVHLNY
ncbi:MAG: diguanylate cyclase [Proteobacteria bacterium]|nr:diguanylate cyclase [Pseudomonadota bacterium]